MIGFPGCRFQIPDSRLSSLLWDGVRGFLRENTKRDADLRLTQQENGRGPPTSPALRLRVLTPRNRYAHRGGRRGQRLFTTRRKLQSPGPIVLRNTDGGANFQYILTS